MSKNRPLARSLFDEEHRMDDLTKLGDPLLLLDVAIPWEEFRSILDEALRMEDKGRGGRPPYDSVLMFKILILQQLHHVSDAQMQYLINDRLSFMRFLRLGLSDRIPDEKTIWLYRERLTKAGIIEGLFSMFHAALERHGLIPKDGVVVDVSFIEAPIQRNTREENQQIKDGVTPEEWSEPKCRQKDITARFSTKNGRRHYGYKNHIKITQKTKLITRFHVTSADVHDSQGVVKLLDDNDAGQCLYADSAYSGKPIADIIETRFIVNEIQEKGARYVKLDEHQIQENHRKSRIRCRIEHVFGAMVMQIGPPTLRCIGLVRAHTVIGLRDLTYNMLRLVFYVRQGLVCV